MIKTNITSLRDPFVLVEGMTYYLYGSDVSINWREDSNFSCYKNVTGRLDGEWLNIGRIVEFPQEAISNRWAPEVHKYKGGYYLFATYFSDKTKHRGCVIFYSASPEGPFREITNGQITPKEWDAIDGTLYVDETGQPWLVFVREWISTEDKVGRMAIARLSDDLTHLVSEPVEIFRADSPQWAVGNITDGCFMYKTSDGQLLMLWSNFNKDGYCVAIARSNNGKIDGEWLMDETLLFSKEICGDADGGHGMIFKDFQGDLYLAIHSPNWAKEQVKERVVFIPIVEEKGSLRCVISH